MATSGTISSQITASEAVTFAMQELGVLSAGEVPEGEDFELGLRSLNWMLKSWSARGMTSWRDAEKLALFAAGTAMIELVPHCLDVTAARVIRTGGAQVPLQRWELAQYRQVPNKAVRGVPTAYSISKTVSSVNMTLWPVPSADINIAYDYARIPEDVTEGTQTIDVPQEWSEAVYLALAARLAQSFGVSRIDTATAQIVAQRAASLEQLLLDSDRPASIYMGSAFGRYF